MFINEYARGGDHSPQYMYLQELEVEDQIVQAKHYESKEKTCTCIPYSGYISVA